jgi:hypothetical protein
MVIGGIDSQITGFTHANGVHKAVMPAARRQAIPKLQAKVQRWPTSQVAFSGYSHDLRASA